MSGTASAAGRPPASFEATYAAYSPNSKTTITTSTTTTMSIEKKMKKKKQSSKEEVSSESKTKTDKKRSTSPSKAKKNNHRDDSPKRSSKQSGSNQDYAEERDEPNWNENNNNNNNEEEGHRQVELCLEDHENLNHHNNNLNHNDDGDDNNNNNGMIVIPTRAFPDGDAMSVTSELTGNDYLDDDDSSDDDDENGQQPQHQIPVVDDEFDSDLPDFHKYLKKADWAGCARALDQLEHDIAQRGPNGAFLFHRALLQMSRSKKSSNKSSKSKSSNNHNNKTTLLHELCYRAPTYLAQTWLDALQRHCEHDPEAIRQVLTGAQDAHGNTALHLCCAHMNVHAAYRNDDNDGATTATSKKKKKGTRRKSVTSASGRRSESRSKSRRRGASKSPSKRKSRTVVVMSDCETVTETTEEMTDAGCSRNKKDPPQSTTTTNASTAEGQPESTQQQQQDAPILDLTILKALVLMAPELLSMTNKMGDTPLHLLVSSQGFCGVAKNPKKTTSSSSKKKKKSQPPQPILSESVRLQAEMAAEDALKSLLNVVPHEIGMKVNQTGRTLLHCAISQGAFERVLVQIMARLPFCASVPDARGLYPLHYVAAFMGTFSIPWTFAQDLIQAYPAALIAQTKAEGDTPLHSLLYAVQQRKHQHDEKQRKRQLKSKRTCSVKEFYLDRSTSKLAEMLLKPVARPTRDRAVSLLDRSRQNGIEGPRDLMKKRQGYFAQSFSNMEHVLNHNGNKTSPSNSIDEQRQDITFAPRPSRLEAYGRQKSVRFNAPDSDEAESGDISSLMIFNHDSLSPLHCCAIADTPQGLVKLLLDKSGDTAQRACASRTPPLPAEDNGGFGSGTPNYGATPLHLALARSETSDLTATIEALLQRGGNALTVQDSHGLTPLAVALLNPELTSSLLKSLIKASTMSIGIPTHDHHWPLHLAFEASDVKIEESTYRALIQATSSRLLPSMLTLEGDSPLHLACSKPGISKKVVKMLLEKHDGAKFLRNKKGQLPCDLAGKYNPNLIKEVPQLDVPFVVKDNPHLESVYH